MNPLISEAIEILQSLPEEHGEPRDQALVGAMVAIVNQHQNQATILVSLIMSFLACQPDQNEAFIHFTNYMTSAWLAYQQHQQDIKNALIDRGTIH